MNEIDTAAYVERLQRHAYNLARSFVIELRRQLGVPPALILVQEAAWPSWRKWVRVDPIRASLDTNENAVLFVAAWREGARAGYARDGYERGGLPA